MPDLTTMLSKFLASLYGGFGTGISYNPAGVVSSQFAAVSNGTTVETDLLTYTLPAGALSANGMGVRITTWGTMANNGNTKTVRVYFGATAVTTLATAVAANQQFFAQATILRVTATTQTAVGNLFWTGLSAANLGVSTPAETLSGAIVLKLTGQSGTAGGDVTSAGFVVEALP